MEGSTHICLRTFSFRSTVRRASSRDRVASMSSRWAGCVGLGEKKEAACMRGGAMIMVG